MIRFICEHIYTEPVLYVPVVLDEMNFCFSKTDWLSKTSCYIVLNCSILVFVYWFIKPRGWAAPRAK